VRWGDLAPALLTVSVTEAFAVALLSEPALLPEAVRVLLAGSRASSAPTEPGALAQAFAGLGLLTLLRLALATHVHVDALRASAAGASPRRWQHAALLVLAFYSASRLAIWWGLDLIRGRSFES
jgi:hypothetical protein